MKIVRLSAAQLREWRDNTSHLVDDEGHLTSVLERPLEMQLAQVSRSARSQRKSLQQKVSIAGREYLLGVEVTRVGMNAEDLALRLTVNGQRVVTGREVMAAKMLQEHGECQLRSCNGVIIKVVRDPGTHRPTLKESQQIAPKPEHCPCKVWGRPHPGTHYPTCEWNRVAPPEERAPSDAIPEEEVRALPTEAFASLKLRPVQTPATHSMAARVDPHAVVAQAATIDAPDSCRNECLKWATPPNFPIPAGQHHPTCLFAKAWAIKTAQETPRWLVDLRTGEKVRHASNAEIGESEIQAQRTGSPIIHINETPYAVVLETELAEEEALLSAAADKPVHAAAKAS